MVMCEYEARRNARLVSQRLELEKLLGASEFLNPTWDKHLLGQKIQTDSAAEVLTKARGERKKRSAQGLEPSRRSSRKTTCTPVYCKDILCAGDDEEKRAETKVSEVI
jgi:hypothetical protein